MLERPSLAGQCFGAGNPVLPGRRPGRSGIHYEWAAQVLARALGEASSPGATDVLRRTAHARGEQIGRDLAKPAAGTPPLRAAATALATCGFAPALAPAGQLVLRNCPFASLREGCRDVVCGMNLALIEGVLGGLGVEGVTAALEPQPDTCCVALRSDAAATPSPAPAPGPLEAAPGARRRR
jgi:predicted ArsR family transcriptional regulator